MADVARRHRRSTPSGPFAVAALDLRARGLAAIPVGGEDGKVPLIPWQRWKHPPGRDLLHSLAEKYPDANVGVLTGLSGVTVVDIDDPALVDVMVRRFGDTPLKISTPSGGTHLWYRADGERSRTRLDGIKVDVKAKGGMVVVPPSIRPSGPHAGMRYAFLAGSWDTLPDLPKIKAGALIDRKKQLIATGQRNHELFHLCLWQARFCDSFDDLLDVARTFSMTGFSEPLSDAEIVKTAKSAWQYEVKGQNWSGGPARAIFTKEEVERLIQQPDVLALLAKLKVSHGGREEPFALVARAMYRDNVIPGWGRNRYLAAIKKAQEMGDLTRVRVGGRKRGDPHLYRLTCKGPERGPNITKHRSPG